MTNALMMSYPSYLATLWVHYIYAFSITINCANKVFIWNSYQAQVAISTLLHIEKSVFGDFESQKNDSILAQISKLEKHFRIQSIVGIRTKLLTPIFSPLDDQLVKLTLLSCVIMVVKMQVLNGNI